MNKPREEEKEIEKEIEEILRNQFVDRARPEEKEDHWGVRENTKKLSALFSQALQAQRAELLEKIESIKVSEMSASEGVEVVLTEDTPEHRNLKNRLYGSHKPTWITAEIYNIALDDLKAEVEKLV